MKIGLVSPYDYSFPGGVVQHIAHLAYNFQQQGHEVKILAPCLKEDMQYFEEEVTSIGRPMACHPCPTVTGNGWSEPIQTATAASLRMRSASLPPRMPRRAISSVNANAVSASAASA